MAKYVLYENESSQMIPFEKMTSTGYSVDDGNTVYNSNCGYAIGFKKINKIYVHGNCYFVLQDSSDNNIVTFQPSTSDGRINNFYMLEDTAKGYCAYTWVGRSKYNGSDDLTFQVKVFEDGVIEFLCLKSFSSTSSSITIHEASKTIKFNYIPDTSYVFLPSEKNGTNFTIHKGKYELQDEFILIEDEGVLKTYNEESEQYEEVGELPYTKQMFLDYGYGKIPNTRAGINTSSPKVYIYTDLNVNLKLTTEYLEKKWYKIYTKNTYNVEESKIKRITSSVDVDEHCEVRYLLNKNGEGWFSYLDEEWKSVNMLSSSEIDEKGMTKEQLEAITTEVLNEFNSFGFGIFIKKISKESKLKINNIDFEFVNEVNEEVIY